MRTHRVMLRAVLYQEDGLWIAHCLELDVVGDGTTQREALDQLTANIKAQIEESFQLGAQNTLFSSAEPEILRMFFAGEHHAYTNTLEFVIDEPGTDDRWSFDNLQVHQYENDAATA